MSTQVSTPSFVPPTPLVESIRAGRCVAFVGAGFAAPTIPGWHGLLTQLAARVADPADSSRIKEWLGPSADKLTSRDFEGLGEELKAALGSEAEFRVHLREVLSVTPSPGTVKRLELLRAIPFHCVLTTNFDELLGQASLPDAETFAGLLTAETREWWHHEFWDRGERQAHWDKRLIALHGRAAARRGELVFTTRSYRRLLHEVPAYRAFLRTLFATRNVLFLGFSFTDAYINELRSEILAMIGVEGAGRGLTDYAILEDVPPALASHLEKRDALHPLSFSTKGAKTKNFDGFDRWLEAIHDATAPRESLRAKLQGKRILWCDPARQRNAPGKEILRGARSDGVFVEEVETVEQAVAALERSGATPYDLVITRWGHRAPGASDALELLERLAHGPRPPVVVFASGKQREVNRPLALRRGALAYTDTWSELFKTLERLLTDGDRRG
ncbi:MAG TPA: SIR2 family protein [Polyangiaceae bacterium]|nr:SIR2 family protein [Polyangiaceae bacterium]